MLQNHGLLPHQLWDVPIPTLMALSQQSVDDPERLHLERLVRKGIIAEDEVEGHYEAMQIAKAEREARKQKKR